MSKRTDQFLTQSARVLARVVDRVDEAHPDGPVHTEAVGLRVAIERIPADPADPQMLAVNVAARARHLAKADPGTERLLTAAARVVDVAVASVATTGRVTQRDRDLLLDLTERVR